MPKFIGLDNYARLLAGQHLLGRVPAFGRLDRRHGADPDRARPLPRCRAVRLYRPALRPARLERLRAAFYLPQILPVAVAGVLWGWILSPIGVLNTILDTLGLDARSAELARRPGDGARLGDVRAWSGCSSAVRWSCSWPACRASIRRSTRRRNWTAPAGWRASAASPSPMLKPEIFVVGLTDDDRRAQGVRAGLCADLGRAGQCHHRAVLFCPTTSSPPTASAIAPPSPTVQTLITIVLGLVFLRVQRQQTEGALMAADTTIQGAPRQAMAVAARARTTATARVSAATGVGAARRRGAADAVPVLPRRHQRREDAGRLWRQRPRRPRRAASISRR